MIELRRIAELPDATLGVLLFDCVPRLVTLELPWQNNERNVSRIPAGRYTIERTISPRFGRSWLVKDVPNRSHILFHRGNKPEDTEGCILVGFRFGDTLGAATIHDSIDGIKWLDAYLVEQTNATLEIVDDFRA